MAKAADGGFVSFYRSNDRLEAIYLLNVDGEAYEKHYKAGGSDVYEFVATKAIESAVEVYNKTPKKAVVSVVDFEALDAALTGGDRPKAAAPAAAAASAPAAKAAPAKRGRKPGSKAKAPAKKAAAPAKKAASAKASAAAARGKKSSIPDAALKEFASMLKKGASKAEIEKMLKSKHGLKYSPASYYNWKSRAEQG